MAGRKAQPLVTSLFSVPEPTRFHAPPLKVFTNTCARPPGPAFSVQATYGCPPRIAMERSSAQPFVLLTFSAEPTCTQALPVHRATYTKALVCAEYPVNPYSVQATYGLAPSLAMETELAVVAVELMLSAPAPFTVHWVPFQYLTCTNVFCG